MIFRINVPKVTHQVFDTEVVIVNLDSGNYYSARGSGIQIWRDLEAGSSGESIVRRFGDSAGAAAATEEFLGELVREELIVPVTDAASPTDRAISETLEFVRPTLEKFTDMQDLLLLDPIHELDESGWPRPKSELSE